ETLLALSSVQDTTPISQKVLAEIARGFGTEHLGFLMLDEGGHAFRRIGYTEGADDPSTVMTLPVEDSGPLGEVALQRRTLTRFDVQQEPGLRDLPFLQGINGLLVTPT